MERSSSCWPDVEDRRPRIAFSCASILFTCSCRVEMRLSMDRFTASLYISRLLFRSCTYGLFSLERFRERSRSRRAVLYSRICASMFALERPEFAGIRSFTWAGSLMNCLIILAIASWLDASKPWAE